MRQTLLIFCLLLSIQGLTQVPVPRGEMGIAEPGPPQDTETTGTYLSEGKYGFVLPGNNFQEAVYDKITYGINGFIVQKENKFGIADNKGRPLTKIEFDSIATQKTHYIVKKRGNYGLLSKLGHQLLSNSFSKIKASNLLVTVVEDEHNKLQLIFNQTENILQQEISAINLYPNLAIVKSQGKFGVVTDKIIVPFEYDSIAPTISRPVKNNQVIKQNPRLTTHLSQNPVFDFMVLKHNKLGLIKSDGTEIYPAENDEIKRESMFSYYVVKKDHLNSIYFPSSHRRTAFLFSRAYADGYGYVMAVKNSKTGVFNLQGDEIVPFEYDDDGIYQYSGIGFRVTKNKKRGIVDSQGKIVVPTVYDDVSTMYSNGFRNFIKVTSENKQGVVNLQGEIIIPVEFEWIDTENNFFKVKTPEPNNKIGLYDQQGQVIVPAAYQWITKSATENSQIIILKKKDHAFNFLDKNNQLILAKDIAEYGYVLDENRLLNPFSANGKHFLYLKNNKGKFGLLNEITGTLDVPMIYDRIIQKFEDEKHSYFSVQKGNKFGLVTETNHIILPLKYSDLKLDFITHDAKDNYHIVVSKGKKYGTVNLKNENKIPFRYNQLDRISDALLFKAKKNKGYQIIDGSHQPIVEATFDEVSNFERLDAYEYSENPRYQALTFLNGNMKVIDNSGSFLSQETQMQPHKGFTTFDELKSELIKALDSPDDQLLKIFIDKIVPSEHLLYFLKNNIFNQQSLAYTPIPQIKEKYYQDLMRFKHSYWLDNSGFDMYDRSSLTEVIDYTLYREGFVTNARNTDHAFGNVKYLEKILRNAIKINGFWISSYFMKHSF